MGRVIPQIAFEAIDPIIDVGKTWMTDEDETRPSQFSPTDRL
jgi:hypothetical protein